MCLSQVTVSVRGLLDNVENDNSFCCNPSDIHHAVDKLGHGTFCHVVIGIV